jgi:hypothetical protein
LIDLKRPALRHNKENVGVDVSPPPFEDKPHYPYGMRLHLEKEELEALGEQIADKGKGDRFEIKAVVEVCSISANEDEYGDSASMGLQVQKIDIGKSLTAKTTVRDALKALRGKRS